MNKGPLPRKTVLSLWFIHDTGMMTEILKLMGDELVGQSRVLCEWRT